MKKIVLLVSAMLLSTLATSGLIAQTSERMLPADIDPMSYSRLPLLLKDSFDAEGQRIFETINGYIHVWELFHDEVLFLSVSFNGPFNMLPHTIIL